MLDKIAAASGDGEHSLQLGDDEAIRTDASLLHSKSLALPETSATR